MFTFLNGLFAPEAFDNFAKVEYPFNLQLISDQLKLKLEEDPSIEVFAPLVFFHHEPSVKDPGRLIKIAPYKHFISNKGRVVNLRSADNVKPYEVTLDSDGYPCITVKIRKRNEQLTLHRAIACAFVAPEEPLKGSHPRDLIVVHLDNDKLNYDPSNLKWAVALTKEG